MTLDDKPLPRSPSHQKPLDLLQALVALGGREVDEDKLAELFWSEAEGDAARRNLKINIHRLRKLLPENALVWTEGKLSLDARQVWVDVWALERELNRLDQASPTEAADRPRSLNGYSVFTAESSCRETPNPGRSPPASGYVIRYCASSPAPPRTCSPAIPPPPSRSTSRRSNSTPCARPYTRDSCVVTKPCTGQPKWSTSTGVVATPSSVNWVWLRRRKRRP